MGTKAQSPRGELSQKPVQPRSPAGRETALRRSLLGSPERSARASPPPLTLAPLLSAAPRVAGAARVAPAGGPLTLATDWRQVGSDRQQQHPCCRHGRALHPLDLPGPRRSFPGRWARVAIGTSGNFAPDRKSRSAPLLAARGRKPARIPEASSFLPAPVPTLQTVHKAL